MEENGKDIYAQVTAKIVADLENGVRSWNQPWTNARAGGEVLIPIRHNGVAYRGVNVLLLWIEDMRKGFRSPKWMTYHQSQLLGGQVRQGERGSMVVFTRPLEVTQTDEAGAEVEKNIRLLRRYIVFNVEQIDGLPVECCPQPAPPRPVDERIEAADSFVKATCATVLHGGDRAFYAPSRDTVQMPPFERFTDKEAYYGTLLHELTHWTGHDSRLKREFGKMFGDRAYANEELVAELGAAFLCATLGITPEIREDRAAYIGDWLAILKEDNRAIFRAAAHAQRAADFLSSFQSPQPGPDTDGVLVGASDADTVGIAAPPLSQSGRSPPELTSDQRSTPPVPTPR
jgi:antirestriction protein ArdC